MGYNWNANLIFGGKESQLSSKKMLNPIVWGRLLATTGFLAIVRLTISI